MHVTGIGDIMVVDNSSFWVGWTYLRVVRVVKVVTVVILVFVYDSFNSFFLSGAFWICSIVFIKEMG